MSITEKRFPTDETEKHRVTSERRPYACPRIHQDDILGPILCASQGQGGQPDAGTPCVPPGAPWCQ